MISLELVISGYGKKVTRHTRCFSKLLGTVIIVPTELVPTEAASWVFNIH